MIKEGVVKKEKTPCPVTGEPCNCEHKNGECEYYWEMKPGIISDPTDDTI